MTLVDTQAPKPPRTSPNEPHYAAAHAALWGGGADFDPSDYGEDELCDCDQCERYAEYCIDLRLAGARESNPLHVDHIRPLVDGGTDHLSNLWLLCRTCNSAKCAQPLERFLARRKDLYIHPSATRSHWPLGEGVKRPRAARLAATHDPEDAGR